jgi:hypothetical protein
LILNAYFLHSLKNHLSTIKFGFFSLLLYKVFRRLYLLLLRLNYTLHFKFPFKILDFKLKRDIWIFINCLITILNISNYLDQWLSKYRLNKTSRKILPCYISFLCYFFQSIVKNCTGSLKISRLTKLHIFSSKCLSRNYSVFICTFFVPPLWYLNLIW